MTRIEPTVVLQVPVDGRLGWRRFDQPIEIITATDTSEVPGALARVEAAAAAGLIAAGFVSYEAAPALDPALTVRPGSPAPLVWFALFAEGSTSTAATDPVPTSSELAWRPVWTEAEHATAVDSVKSYIARGDTYQVNLTTRLEAPFEGDPQVFFGTLVHGRGSRYAAYIDTGDWVVCSVSPELFFRLEGERLWSRPMKGTAPRGRTLVEDRERAAWLHHSSKNRAENIMIVDMIRNDLGRVANPGSVRVLELWKLEKYPSLWQMTSTVEATTAAPIPEVFAALFPCASITGAPKVRAMQIIADLETTPRGVYSGAIGSIGPGRRARFNVAIRTVQIDRRRKTAVYGTGGGIVWESVATEEWRECQTKALVLASPAPSFDIFETLLWMPDEGYRWLDRHLDRWSDSAAYFDVPVDLAAARDHLSELADSLPPLPHKVRLLLGRNGAIRVEAEGIELESHRWRLAIAAIPVSSTDPFLFHKTTHRHMYDRCRARFPDHDDVLLWNENGELTETTVANIVIYRDGRYLTPTLACGLLPGTLRGELLDRGELIEARIRIDELDSNPEIYLINSVRGWIACDIDPDTLPARH